VWSRANPLGSLRLLRSHHDLLRLASVSFLMQLGQMLWPSIFVLYTGYRYHWSPMTTGLMMMVGSSMGIAVQSFLVGPFVKRYGERGALITGLVSIMIAMIWYGTAPTGWLYIAGMPIGVLAGLMIPGLQGLMTRHVGPSEQGQLQGANQSLIGMASVLGPIIYGLSFAWTVRHPEWHLPGLGQYLAAAITGFAVFLAIGERKPRGT